MLLMRNFLKLVRKSLFNSSYKFASSTSAAAIDTPLSSEFVANLIEDIDQHGQSYGFHTDYFKALPCENVVVEFSSPNIAKLFHAGHYRSTVVGNVISNVFTAAGHRVFKTNYLGDWGLQFALLAIGYQKYGNEELLKTEPLKHLYDLYVKATNDVETDRQMYIEARSFFEKMEHRDPEALKFWKICRDYSIEEYNKLYQELGVQFDEYSGESISAPLAHDILKVLDDKSLLCKDDNALTIDLRDSCWLEDADERYKRPVLARSNGTSLYLTRDVATAIERYDRFKFDRMIYVTDKSQEIHFKQLFAILEIMGMPWAQKKDTKLHHKTFGRVQKMKTRKGDVIFLKDILEEAYQRSYDDRSRCDTRKVNLEDDNITKTLALSGLIYHDLRTRLSKGYKFNWDTALASKGSSGLYLQYTYSRLCSLERYTGVRVTKNVDPCYILSQPSLVALLKQASDYLSVTEALYESLEPSVLVKYLYELSRVAARAFESCIVKGQPQEDAEARLASFYCAKVVLGNGLKVLGITPLEQH